MTVYEFPLNERIRTWLRLEDLFDKARYFLDLGGARAHHAALLAVFDIVDITARSELRNELIQELERQRGVLESLRKNPAVDGRRLDHVLETITAILTQLFAMTGKMGQHVRDNEWLASIKGRSGIPGGTCSFDLPVYHFWLNQADAARVADINAWLNPLQPIRHAVHMALRLLREGGQVSSHQAVQGSFQLMLGGRSAHLLRVGVAQPCAPEVSANKYAVNIRFLVPDTQQKPRPCEQDVDFELTFCNL